MIQHHPRTAPSPRTRRTRRTQPPVPDLAVERLIALPIPQSLGFLEQHRRPHMGIIRKPLPNISLEPVERIRPRQPPLPEDPLTRQVSPNRLAVSTHMAGNSRNRPTPPPQHMNFHELLLCQHQPCGPPPRCQTSHPPARRGPPSAAGICGHSMGKYTDRNREISMTINNEPTTTSSSTRTPARHPRPTEGSCKRSGKSKTTAARAAGWRGCPNSSHRANRGTKRQSTAPRPILQRILTPGPASRFQTAPPIARTSNEQSPWKKGDQDEGCCAQACHVIPHLSLSTVTSRRKIIAG